VKHIPWIGLVASSLIGSVFIVAMAFASARPAGLMETDRQSSGHANNHVRASEQPISKRHIAVDSTGNIYVSDSRESVVYRISRDGKASILSGTRGVRGFRNGSPEHSLFFWPGPMAVGKNNELYVADKGNRVIRKVLPSGWSSTLVGQPGLAGDRDGPALEARVNLPAAMTLAPDGSLLFSDANTVRKLSTDGTVSTIAGNALAKRLSQQEIGPGGGLSSGRLIGRALGLATTTTGDVLVVDGGPKALLAVAPGGKVKAVAQLRAGVDKTLFVGEELAFSAPRELALANGGTAFVLDTGTGDVWRVSADRQRIERWLQRSHSRNDATKPNLAFGHPSDLAMGPDGALYLVDLREFAVRRVTMDGRIDQLKIVFQP
jgi:hypothetical protein